MSFEFLKKHRFQFIKLVSSYSRNCGKSKANFNDHSNLLHIVNGRGRVFLNSQMHNLERGIVIALPAFVECHFEYEIGMEMHNLHYNMWDMDGKTVEEKKRFPLIFRPDFFNEAEKILRKIKNNCDFPSNENFDSDVMAHELVLKYYMSIPLESAENNVKDERMSIIYKALQAPDCVDYDANKMAKACYLSVSQMNRKFKHYFNESPRKFWEKNRFNTVCRLLTETNKSLAEISGDFSFIYQSHFSKWFKNIAKVSPAEYRRRFSGEGKFML